MRMIGPQGTQAPSSSWMLSENNDIDKMISPWDGHALDIRTLTSLGLDSKNCINNHQAVKILVSGWKSLTDTPGSQLSESLLWDFPDSLFKDCLYIFPLTNPFPYVSLWFLSVPFLWGTLTEPLVLSICSCFPSQPSLHSIFQSLTFIWKSKTWDKNPRKPMRVLYIIDNILWFSNCCYILVLNKGFFCRFFVS